MGLKFFILSIALARTSTILIVVREITLIEIRIKHVILEQNRKCTKSIFQSVVYC
jgi:hypothetical protein